MLRFPLYANEPGEIGFGAKLLEDSACGIEFQFRACPIALLTAGVAKQHADTSSFIWSVNFAPKCQRPSQHLLSKGGLVFGDSTSPVTREDIACKSGASISFAKSASSSAQVRAPAMSPDARYTSTAISSTIDLGL